MAVADRQYQYSLAWSDVSLAAVLFLVVVGISSTEWSNGIMGGVSVVGAERIIAGDVPYRDFWTMYAPGHFYLEAIVFQVFGKHILIDAIAGSVVTALAASTSFFLVRNFGGGKFVAFLGGAIFAAAMYDTGYFKHLGSYPTSALFVFVSLGVAGIFYRSGRMIHILISGVAAGAAIVFKHDVGGYTAVAVVIGLAGFYFTSDASSRVNRFLVSAGWFTAGAAIVALPIFAYFSIVAGPEMFVDLVIFPLTDFPFSRPEIYPSLLPTAVFSASGTKIGMELIKYLVFAIPFAAFLLSIATLAIAYRRRLPGTIAAAVTVALLFLFHYLAAHVQINTHIVSLSFYGFVLGALLVGTIEQSETHLSRRVLKPLAAAIAVGWVIILMLPTVYGRWTARGFEKSSLTIPKVSGVRLPRDEASDLERLYEFVDANVAADKKIFVGLHRHDVTVISEYMLYFILDRKGATRHDELHPAITDTPAVQREMIADLERERVGLLVLKHMFADAKLDEMKTDFKRNLPLVGATELDSYIQSRFYKSQQFGPYEVWLRLPEATRATGQ